MNALFGSDVSGSVSNISYTGITTDLANTQIGIFTDLDQITEVSSGNAGAFSSFSTGVVFSSGFVNSLETNNSSGDLND